MTAYYGTIGRSTANRITADRAGRLIVRHGSFALSAALAQNDTIDLLYLPKRHLLVPNLCAIHYPELDSDAAPTGTLDVGFSGGDDDALFDGIAMGGGAASYLNIPVAGATIWGDTVSDSDRLIQAIVKTAVATGVASGTINYVIAYRPYEG